MVCTSYFIAWLHSQHLHTESICLIADFPRCNLHVYVRIETGNSVRLNQEREYNCALFGMSMLTLCAHLRQVDTCATHSPYDAA